jgi:catechol 2,3-dioxygenase-like lactoylglutathione lyase family enzyme
MGLEINGLCPLIQVFHMPRSLRFYRDILGFEIVSDSGKGDDSSWVWLRLKGADLMLNDQYDPGKVPEAPPAERVRWHHDTCLYFGCPDPEAAYLYLRGKGFEPKPPTIAPYGMKQLFLSDPDNYNLCFQCPAEREVLGDD